VRAEAEATAQGANAGVGGVADFTARRDAADGTGGLFNP